MGSPYQPKKWTSTINIAPTDSKGSFWGAGAMPDVRHSA